MFSHSKSFLFLIFILSNAISGCSLMSKTEKLVIVPFVLPPDLEEISYSAKTNCKAFDGRGSRTSVEGDFDGDGIRDIAKLVRRKAEEQEYLYVWVSSLNFKPIELDEIGAKEARNNMAIALGTRGQIMQNACAKGYVELCENDNPKEIKFAHDFLWYSQCEATASAFYWSPQTKSFKRVW